VCAFTGLVHYLLPEELILPVLVSLALSIIIFGISYIFIRDIIRAGIITTATMFLIFSFDALAIPCNNALEAMGMKGDDRWYLLPYILFSAWVIYALAKAKTDYKFLTSSLNILGVLMVAGNLGYIWYHTMQFSGIVNKNIELQNKEIAALSLDGSRPKPDVYYVILDAMGRSDSLKQFYNYDNSAFINALKAKGFVVPEFSKSNYQMTCLSLPSSLNYGYLGYLEKEVGRESNEYTILYRLIQRNRISMALKKIGYKIVNVSSGYGPSDYTEEADYNVGFRFGNIFHIALARNTVFGPLQRNFDFLAEAARKVRLFAFEHTDQVLKQPSPKFVFMHIPVPHPPFLFDENGAIGGLDRVSLAEDFQNEKYVQQVKFIEKKTLALLDKLEADGKEKVIILQGDHGPAGQPGVEGNPTPSFLKERMRIFNAYKMPRVDPSAIDPGITPVNSFRLLLKQYFNANLEYLPNECIYSPAGLPYQMVNVTKDVTP
jgi:hypothetical protein